MTEHHSIVPHDAWIEARQPLLDKEKAFNRLRDELSAERRALPWEPVDKAYVFDGPGGRRSLGSISTSSAGLLPTTLTVDVLNALPSGLTRRS
jgi:predicted dithiol-disulfide oxidoreductase (DUF899 family)